MERVIFLVERTGDRIPCLLNPEHLEVRRTAGIVRRRSVGGGVIGNARTDDPLVATGGGVTEYELKLLFDVDLLGGSGRFPAGQQPLPPLSEPAGAGGVPDMAATALTDDESDDEAQEDWPGDVPAEPPTGDAPPPVEASPDVPLPDALPPPPAAPAPTTIDVRTLTQPLWALAENGEPLNGAVAPQRVRFIWGRSWNVPGVILAVAERHERFDPQGVPRRSWLSLLLRRVEEQVEAGNAPLAPTSPQFEVNPGGSNETGIDHSGDDSVTVPVDEGRTALTPLHMIAAERYGDARYDRAIAEYNDLDDMLELTEGQTLRLPPQGRMAAAA